MLSSGKSSFTGRKMIFIQKESARRNKKTVERKTTVYLCFSGSTAFSCSPYIVSFFPTFTYFTGNTNRWHTDLPSCTTVRIQAREVGAADRCAETRPRGAGGTERQDGGAGAPVRQIPPLQLLCFFSPAVQSRTGQASLVPSEVHSPVPTQRAAAPVMGLLHRVPARAGNWLFRHPADLPRRPSFPGSHSSPGAAVAGGP